MNDTGGDQVSFEKSAIRKRRETKGTIVLGDFQNGHFSVATHAATFPLRDLLICEYFYHPSR